MRNFFQKLNRMLTAIAHAEAGDLDTVKTLLDQGRISARKNPSAAKEDSPRSAVILDFKRAPRPTTRRAGSTANVGTRS